MPSAVDIHAGLVAGRFGVVDVVRAALRRLAAVDEQLCAFVEVTGTAAIARATALDRAIRRGRAPGALTGVPIAVKGRSGMAALQTRRLLAAGAVPIGLTSTPRGPGAQTWGFTERGPTRNPWRPDLSPGGSSAGSAVAVAAGVVPLATAADGAGSARIPAAWCGIFGLKPSGGLAQAVDRAGLAVPAVVVRDPRDLVAWTDVVLGPLPPAGPPRTAIWSADLGFARDQLDEEVVAIATAAAADLALRTGLRLPDGPAVALADPGRAWRTLRDPAATPAALAVAHAVRDSNDARLAALFDRADVLMTPTTPGPPHGHDGPGEHVSVALAWAFNLSGHPALSVPAGTTAAGAPVGLQIVARRRADRSLLHVACSRPPAPVAPVSGGGRPAEDVDQDRPSDLLDACPYGHMMRSWHEQRRRRTRSTRSPSRSAATSWCCCGRVSGR